MSARQRVVFTALPNGLVPGEPGQYRLSVHIAPQLRTDADTTLATFPDWVDWPATVNAVVFTVSFGGDAAIPATLASAPAQSALWTALFQGGALVRSHTKPDVRNRRKRSYPARNVMAYIQKQYTDVALASPEEFPHIDDLTTIDAFGALDIDTLKQGFSSPFSGLPDVEATLALEKAYTNDLPFAKPLSDFYQLYRFHRSRFDMAPYNDASNPQDLPPAVKPVL
ncbi:MAG TPA: hypothetical protein VF244_02935, partial [Acidimicrobiales bacterium]